MSQRSNLPFVATGLLLGLWGTRSFDNEVWFLGVAFVVSFVLVEVFGPSTAAMQYESMDTLSRISSDSHVLSYLLFAAFSAGVGVLGAALQSKSPFAMMVVYAVIVSGLFRDVSVVGEARLVLVVCFFLSGAFCEALFRVNTAAMILALILMDKEVALTGQGQMETFCMACALLVCLVYEFATRFLFVPIKSLSYALFISVTAFVMVESSFELAGISLPDDQLVLLNASWDNCFSFGTKWEMSKLKAHCVVASPAIACLFALAHALRNLGSLPRRSRTYVKYQQILGILIGTLVGLQLWRQYRGFQSMLQMLSPVSLTWTFANVAFIGAMFTGNMAELFDSSELFRVKFWMGKPPVRKAGVMWLPSESMRNTGTNVLSRLGVYPDVHEEVSSIEEKLQAIDTHNSKKSKNAGPLENATAQFARASLTNSVHSLTNEVASKLQARCTTLAEEIRVHTSIGEPTLVKTVNKLKQRKQQLDIDLQDVQTYADNMKKDATKRDEEALALLNAYQSTIDRSHSEWPRLEQMTIAIEKRMRKRKKDQEAALSPPAPVDISLPAPLPEASELLYPPSNGQNGVNVTQDETMSQQTNKSSPMRRFFSFGRGSHKKSNAEGSTNSVVSPQSRKWFSMGRSSLNKNTT